MTLQEMLKSPEAKKLYRKLAMKHHPDKTGGGNDEIMKKLTMIINKKEISDNELFRFNDKLEGKKKSSYDDIEEPEETINYHEMAFNATHFVNTYLEPKGYKVFLMVRKSGKILNLMVTIKWPDGETSSLLMKNIKKYKDQDAFNSAVYKFIKKLI